MQVFDRCFSNTPALWEQEKPDANQPRNPLGWKNHQRANLSHIEHLSSPKWIGPAQFSFSIAFPVAPSVTSSKKNGLKNEARGGIEVGIMTQELPYNYEGYLPGEEEEGDFSRFQQTLKVGTEAPDFEATRLEDGKKVKLSDLTVQSNVVLEFGSFT